MLRSMLQCEGAGALAQPHPYARKLSALLAGVAVPVYANLVTGDLSLVPLAPVAELCGGWLCNEQVSCLRYIAIRGGILYY